ncbi:TrbI/VirB10 family protein [Vibrio lentus]
MKSMLSRFFKEPEGSFDDGVQIEAQTTKRNTLLTVGLVVILLLLGLGAYQFLRSEPVVNQAVDTGGFGEIIEQEFASKDNQSALTSLQIEADTLKSENEGLKKQMESVQQRLESFIADAKRKQDRFQKDMVVRVDDLKTRQLDEIRKVAKETALDRGDLSKTLDPTDEDVSADYQSNPQEFGAPTLPPKSTVKSGTDNTSQQDYAYDAQSKASFPTHGIDSFSFQWSHIVDEQKESKKRTIQNYVPSGTFVTAVVTGGADADAGALGQNNTAPMVFQTVNAGILPNGAKSRLKDCSITGSVFGEISSSRGIVRTNRLSCIFEDDEIIDVPVKGTVFNFGRNGIRGTTILKNGKIVQMAGVAGILTGLGETGKALSATTSTSALGTTSSIDTDKAALNLLGEATSSVGEKLADYYIQLAELYHPIVELNPGNLVNIVFLEGFPLDATEIENYEERVEQAAQVAVQPPVTNTAIVNPLASKLGQAIPNYTPNQGGQNHAFNQ